MTRPYQGLRHLGSSGTRCSSRPSKGGYPTLSKFSLYDFLAVVIPGVFLLWALAEVLGLPALEEALPLKGGITETSLLVVVGYITGLLLQGISQSVTESLLLKAWGGFPSARWLLPEDTRLTDEYKSQLNDAVARRF